MEKAKMSWRELCNYLVAYNEKHNIICKGLVTALNNAGAPRAVATTETGTN